MHIYKMESDDNPEYPAPDEIKPYVAIGPTPDLSITVHKETFDNTFILFTIIFGSALIVFVGVMLYFCFSLSMLPPPPPPLRPALLPLTINTNFGAVSSIEENTLFKLAAPDNGSAYTTKQACLSKKNTIWENNSCICRNNWYGIRFNLEKLDGTY